uniref:EOG090X07L3 n=1 Tax=Lynceus sp. MCZ IZ 141354 TaxID=1930659 RepID=A0A9N6WYJ5_9CRUS|nr:EOG090X07L3 [Lynceus sp. MCZ IZ 141354]
MIRRPPRSTRSEFYSPTIYYTVNMKLEMDWIQRSLPFVFVLVCLWRPSNAQWNTKDYMKREHSLVRPYQGSGITMPFWDFLGHVMVTSSYVRLTPDLQSRQGALWNTAPVKSKYWELQVQFRVTGKGKELFGDGLAIWYTKDRMEAGPVFGSKDYFHGLGIILDTYSNHNGQHNHEHPFISAMIDNGTLHYDHDKDGTHTQLAGCTAKFRNVDHDTYVSIRYEKDVLTVSTDIENRMAWKECFSVAGVKLPTGYYLGVSAATGDLSDNHDVIALKMYELEAEDPLENRSIIVPSALVFEPPREHVEDDKPSMPNVKLFLIMFFTVMAIIALIVVGVMVYQNRQTQNRKRFY